MSKIIINEDKDFDSGLFFMFNETESKFIIGNYNNYIAHKYESVRKLDLEDRKVIHNNVLKKTGTVLLLFKTYTL